MSYLKFTVIGGDLEEFIEKHGGKRTNIEHYLKISRGILSGINVLHSTKQLHRDLKPQNIFL